VDRILAKLNVDILVVLHCSMYFTKHNVWHHDPKQGYREFVTTMKPVQIDIELVMFIFENKSYISTAFNLPTSQLI